MKVRRYRISKPIEYVKDGERKTRWAGVGTLVEFESDDGSVSRKIEIPAIGLEARAFSIEDNKAVQAPVEDKNEIKPEDLAL